MSLKKMRFDLEFSIPKGVTVAKVEEDLSSYLEVGKIIIGDKIVIVKMKELKEAVQEFFEEHGEDFHDKELFQNVILRYLSWFEKKRNKKE